MSRVKGERCPRGQHELPETAQPGMVTKCRKCRASVRIPVGRNAASKRPAQQKPVKTNKAVRNDSRESAVKRTAGRSVVIESDPAQSVSQQFARLAVAMGVTPADVDRPRLLIDKPPAPVDKPRTPIALPAGPPQQAIGAGRLSESAAIKQCEMGNHPYLPSDEDGISRCQRFPVCTAVRIDQLMRDEEPANGQRYYYEQGNNHQTRLPRVKNVYLRSSITGKIVDCSRCDDAPGRKCPHH